MGVIGDPVVGRIREGAVLDAQVLGGTQFVSRQVSAALRRSLARLVGQDWGPQPAAWARRLARRSSQEDQ